VKPRIFVGSSGNAEKFAAAIHARLGKVAECTVWTEGAFALSASTIAGLTKNLRDSDFGIFVFAPDDVASIKGDLLNVPRDNVVYEAGLFSGYLCPERCFIAIPQTVPIHIPTDLLGMTVGHYEDDRTDGNDESAVANFCLKVRQQIEQQGLFDGRSSEILRELTVKFECCEWITDVNVRVEKKKQVAAEIDRFCAAHPVNKHRLLTRHSSGHYIALLSAICNRPEHGDCRLIQQIRPDHLPSGFIYYRLMDAVEAVKANRCCPAQQLSALTLWLKQLPNADGAITIRIARFSAP
jgi:hypothetical protein